MSFNLSKGDKKIARILIDRAIDIEFRAGLEKAKAVITEWENAKLNNKDGYHKLFKVIKEHDKRIAKRYDGLGGSDYLLTVALILHDELITDEDVKDFSEETQEVIYRWISVWKDDRI